jgi:mono/diheme cytochrome c family protein
MDATPMRNSLLFLSRWAIAMAIAASVLLARAVFAEEGALVGSPERGKIAFVKHSCWQCHGFEGQGSIATSNGAVLAPNPLPFEAFASFVRSSNRSMPPYRETILSDSDLTDIYAMLQSIPKAQKFEYIPLLNRQK